MVYRHYHKLKIFLTQQDLTVKIYLKSLQIPFQGALLNREAGEKPARSRHCKGDGRTDTTHRFNVWGRGAIR